MTAGDSQIALAAITFVGTHFILSHPLRGAIVRRIGERGFMLVYSLVAAVTFGWLAWVFWVTPAEAPFYVPGDTTWAIATLVMLLASVLLMGSLIGNPALPNPGAAPASPAAARGVYAITRHPMMWAFALWGLVHLAIMPTPKTHIVATAIIVLSLVGAALQDRKKERLQPDTWRAWEAKTSYWPFGAIAAGRARFGGFRPHDLAGGVVIWLAATWAHLPIAGWPAGIWRWIG